MGKAGGSVYGAETGPLSQNNCPATPISRRRLSPEAKEVCRWASLGLASVTSLPSLVRGPQVTQSKQWHLISNPPCPRIPTGHTCEGAEMGSGQRCVFHLHLCIVLGLRNWWGGGDFPWVWGVSRAPADCSSAPPFFSGPAKSPWR